MALASWPAARSSVLGPQGCFAPLAQWCGRHACPDHGESVAALERLDPSALCHRAQAGTCGDLRFTTRANPISGITHYFGADGKVVGVTTFSAARQPQPCDTDWRHYGSGPFRCTIVVEHEYCRHPLTHFDARGERRGRIVDAATGEPLPGAVVVAAWFTELPPHPAQILFGLAIGGHGASRHRTARVHEAVSAADGRFVIPPWTEADQLHPGPILFAEPALFAIAPGHEPATWDASEPEEFGALAGPPNKVLRLRPTGTASQEPLRRFLAWLDANAWNADEPDAGDTSRLRRAVRATQQRAAGVASQELRQLAAEPTPTR